MDSLLPTLDFWAGWISAYLAMLVLQGLRALAQRLRQWRRARQQEDFLTTMIMKHRHHHNPMSDLWDQPRFSKPSSEDIDPPEATPHG